MKVSEISIEHVAEYLRIDEPCEIDKLHPVLAAAKAYISSYTGIPASELDGYEEFYTVVMVLCQDMYDNRSYYVDRNYENKTVSTILDMHRRNLV
ncbi:MAG: head-tail connector protein [Lachnospiraceae bacterium]|nr:head-tail connector protein [Lachnospiraceae bacterium]